MDSFFSRRLLFAMALILSNSSASAQSSQSSPNPYLDAAERLYRDFEFGEAMRTIEKAVAWPGNSKAEDVRAGILEGIITAQLGKTEKALAAFKRALALDPDAAMPFRVSPKIEELFRRARKEMPPPPPKPAVAPESITSEPAPLPPPPPPVIPPTGPEASTATAPPVAPPTDSTSLEASKPSPPSAGNKVSARDLSWIPAVGGVLLAGAGTYFLIQAKSDSDQLTGQSVLSIAQANQLVSNGQLAQDLAWVGFGAGAAAIVAGAMMFVLGDSGAHPSVALSVSPRGVVLTGVLP
jgi:hypothetical protein